MRLEAKKYLYDIEQAAELLGQFTAGKTFADYARDARPRLNASLKSSAKRSRNWPNSTLRLPNASASTATLLRFATS
jgi:hypothetical protein